MAHLSMTIFKNDVTHAFPNRLYICLKIRTMSTYKRIKINNMFEFVYFSSYIGTMSTNNQTKLNKLLQATPPGVVLQSSWLSIQGYSLDLQQRYKRSHWLQSIGSGAVIRTGDKVDYHGGLYALQTQSGLSVHVGGRSALALLGRAHYLDMGTSQIMLFGGAKEKLPAWFMHHDWTVKLHYFPTSFLPANMGLMEFDKGSFSVKISTPARAMLEALYLSPKHQELFECYELMEGLNNLRPKVVQELLEHCTSVKVKRLFLYLAEKCHHDWLEFVDLSKVDLGSGTRSLLKDGAYIGKYKITVPKEFEKHVQPGL
jgi:hypothetical protein